MNGKDWNDFTCEKYDWGTDGVGSRAPTVTVVESKPRRRRWRGYWCDYLDKLLPTYCRNVDGRWVLTEHNHGPYSTRRKTPTFKWNQKQRIIEAKIRKSRCPVCPGCGEHINVFTEPGTRAYKLQIAYHTVPDGKACVVSWGSAKVDCLGRVWTYRNGTERLTGLTQDQYYNLDTDLAWDKRDAELERIANDYAEQ